MACVYHGFLRNGQVGAHRGAPVTAPCLVCACTFADTQAQVDTMVYFATGTSFALPAMGALPVRMQYRFGVSSADVGFAMGKFPAPKCRSMSAKPSTAP